MLEALEIITDFISNNSITILILLALLIFRAPLSNVISRIISLNFKNGNAELGLSAPIANDVDQKDTQLQAEDQKPMPNSEISETALGVEQEKSSTRISEMYLAFDQGRIEDAERAFKQYISDETDPVKCEENKGFYFYLRFEKAQDDTAINALEKLSLNAVTEESKLNTLTWLGFCFKNSMQYHKETEMWESAFQELTLEPLKTRALVNLSNSLMREELYVDAKRLITDRLLSVDDDQQKALLFSALSDVEKHLGNTSMSIYCKDKSLELDANNRNELFSSAYAASEEAIDEISISNYVKLLKIDKKNSMAMNNLGVRAQEAGLKIIAVKQYKKSSSHNNTLSMANQGFLLLAAGFVDEAESLAKEALKHENPHQNVHNLLAEINEKVTEQQKNWETLKKNSLNRQKQIREYTQQYYLGDPQLLEGNWYVNGVYQLSILIDAGSIEACWNEIERGLRGNSTYSVKISGRVSGSTIEGTYIRKKNEEVTNYLLDFERPTDEKFIGYLSDSNNQIKLISKSCKDNFGLSLFREKV